jgi:hypothetical protein
MSKQGSNASLYVAAVTEARVCFSFILASSADGSLCNTPNKSNQITMAVANLLKLAVLLIGFFGYLTGSQQPSEDAPSVVHNYRNKRSIYLNSKAPILIGNLSKN